MNFFPIPPLEQIALVQIATTLWNKNKPDVRTLAQNLPNSKLYPSEYFRISPVEWKKIERIVIEKVPQLTIPTYLKEKLLSYIQPMGRQILKWEVYHFIYCSFDLDPPNDFCWTPHGTIDKEKTARMLVKDETIDIIKRYKLACTYCLEDYIPELWYKLPESHKISLYNEENIKSDFLEDLLAFWGQYLREKEPCSTNMIKISNPIFFSYQDMLWCAAETYNKTAFEYFLQNQIQSEYSLDEVLLEKIKYIANLSCENPLFISVIFRDYGSELFYFLISQMNEEQQVQVFKECPLQSLECLLDWPWQNLFLKTTSHLFNFLPNFHYEVLKIIMNNVYVGCNDYSYQHIFRNVWKQAPHVQKINIINMDNCYILNKLFLINDQKNIEFIFQDISFTERKQLISSYNGLCLFETMIEFEDWNLLKFFVPLCISSKVEMISFKQKCLETFSENMFSGNNNKLDKFFKLLNDFTHEYNERKIANEGGNNSAKKLHNVKYEE